MSLNVYNTNWSLRHPLRWAREKIKGCHSARLRAKRGYCDNDLWGMCDWVCELFSAMLLDLAKRAHGHPYDMTEQEWAQWLRTMSERFATMREENWREAHKNRYASLLHLCQQKPHVITQDYANIRQQYMMEEKNISAAWEAYVRQTFIMLARHFPDLWD